MTTIEDKARGISLDVLKILGPDWRGRVLRGRNGAWCVRVWTDNVGGHLYNGSHRRVEYHVSGDWQAARGYSPYSRNATTVNIPDDDRAAARLFAKLLHEALHRTNSKLKPKHERLADLAARLQDPWVLEPADASPVGTRFRIDGRHLVVAWCGKPETCENVWLQGRASINQIHGAFLDAAELMRADNPGDERWGRLLDMAEDLGLLSDIGS